MTTAGWCLHGQYFDVHPTTYAMPCIANVGYCTLHCTLLYLICCCCLAFPTALSFPSSRDCLSFSTPLSLAPSACGQVHLPRRRCITSSDFAVDSGIHQVLVGHLHLLLPFLARLSIFQLELQRLVVHQCEPHCHAIPRNGFDSADRYKLFLCLPC